MPPTLCHSLTIRCSMCTNESVEKAFFKGSTRQASFNAFKICKCLPMVARRKKARHSRSKSFAALFLLESAKLCLAMKGLKSGLSGVFLQTQRAGEPPLSARPESLSSVFSVYLIKLVCIVAKKICTTLFLDCQRSIFCNTLNCQ